jgi:regulator of protease activity HflC (stomatin/prohibitin superfamily)
MHDLQQRIQDAMKQAALSDYGIAVVSVDLLQIDPPEELVDALNAVITAESEARALVSRTELQAQQRILAAEQAVAIANAHALAEEAEIRTVGVELATLADQGVLRDYVARRQIEVLGESNRIYLNHTTISPTARS